MKTTIFGGGIKHDFDCHFSAETMNFFKKMLPCAVRDPLSQTILRDRGIETFMTGCPVLTTSYRSVRNPSGLVISDSQPHNTEAGKAVQFLSMLFKCPIVRHNQIRNSDEGDNFLDIGGSAKSMEAVYAKAMNHIGFRLHAHLLRYAMEKPSTLIIEDERGASISQVIGGDVIDARVLLLNCRRLKKYKLNSISHAILTCFAVYLFIRKRVAKNIVDFNFEAKKKLEKEITLYFSALDSKFNDDLPSHGTNQDN